jgi:hypothetical protein
MSWIGVDLDGTLATIEENSNGTIGKPIKPMIDKVKDWLNKDHEVRIFTARADTASEVKKVEDWLEQNGLEGLKITNVKDKDMILLFDDKAVRVIRNTGEICSSCKETISLSAKLQADNYRYREPKRRDFL